jgi:hypothetical protein
MGAREEHKSQKFENELIKKIFAPKDDVRGQF